MEQPVIAATAAAQNPKNHTNFQHLAHLRPANRQTRPLFSSLLGLYWLAEATPAVAARHRVLALGGKALLVARSPVGYRLHTSDNNSF
jgi:hypothetical protein